MSLPNLNFNEWHATHPHITENKLCNSRVSECEPTSNSNNDSNFQNCDNKNSDVSIRNHRNISSNTVALTTQKSLTNNESDGDNQEKVRLINNKRFFRSPSKEVETRALISRVAEYYEQYVRLMGLEKYFVNDVLVTSVSPIKSYVDAEGKKYPAKWLVMG